MENRVSFFERLRGPAGAALFSDEDVCRIEMAYDLTKFAHRAQVRKDGERYFEHPRRVAIALLERVGLYEAPAVIAALAHDTDEDSPQYLSPRKVAILGGRDAERMVQLLSKRQAGGVYAERLLRHADWKTLAIKLCDRHDNMSSLDACSDEFRRKQTDETRDVYLPLFDHLTKIAPRSHRDAVWSLVGDLRNLTESWIKKLGLAPIPYLVE